MNSTVRGRSEETLYESLSYQELHQRSSKGWKEQAEIVMMMLLLLMMMMMMRRRMMMIVLMIGNNAMRTMT